MASSKLTKERCEEVIKELSSFKYGQVLSRKLIPELETVWQWDEVTGLPIFEEMFDDYVRYVPPSFLEKTCAKTRLGRKFISEMESPKKEFELHTDLNAFQQPSAAMYSLAGFIFHGDFKKITVRRDGNRNDVLFVTKNTEKLKPYDLLYPMANLKSCQASGGQRPISDLLDEINLNASRGFYGPGSFPCRGKGNGTCFYEKLMTMSPVVKWGPNDDQHIRVYKRATCWAKDLTYMIHCARCIDEGQFSVYIGETERTGHQRWKEHLGRPSGNTLAARYSASTIDRIVGDVKNGNREQDKCIMRDVYTHFCHVHSSQDRRYTIIDVNYPSTSSRKTFEQIYISEVGDKFDMSTFTGNLNISQ